MGIALMKVSPAQQGAQAEPRTDQPASLQNVIRTQRLEIVDRQGRLRAMVGETYRQYKDGPKAFYTGISLLNEAGRECAALEVTDKSTSPLAEPTLVLRDSDGTERVALGLSGEAPTLSLMDDKGREQAVVQVRKDQAAFTLRHQSDISGLIPAAYEKRIDVVAKRPEQEGTIGMTELALEKPFAPAAQILVHDGATTIALADGKGQERIKIMTAKDGTSQVLTADKNGKMRPAK